MKLLERSYKHEIDGITGQFIGSNGKAWHPFALEGFKAHPNSVREDNIRCDSVSEGHSQNGWQPAVGKSEDKTINQTLRMPNPRMSKRCNKRFSNLTL